MTPEQEASTTSPQLSDAELVVQLRSAHASSANTITSLLSQLAAMRRALEETADDLDRVLRTCAVHLNGAAVSYKEFRRIEDKAREALSHSAPPAVGGRAEALACLDKYRLECASSDRDYRPIAVAVLEIAADRIRALTQPAAKE